MIKIGGNLNLAHNQLERLPQNFGTIKIGGNLNLAHNQLETLPQNFGMIKIGGNLNLAHNQLETLPESFNILIKGGLNLAHNKLNKFPEVFVNIAVNDLNLAENNLVELPFNFIGIKVKGNLNLSNNLLKILPENFGKIHIGGDLNLSNNLLKILPENFEKIHIGGDLNLSNNLLKILPENFGEIHIGGDLNLSYNLLKILPNKFNYVRNKILLNNNYIISPTPHNCQNSTRQKNYCRLDNQTILSLYEENKTCSQCNKMTWCKKCAICKKENIWYCSKDCEIKDWSKPNLSDSHRKTCNNIINTTFIFVCHGILWHIKKTIENLNNISIIETASIGTKSWDVFVNPIIDIYTNNNSLFKDDDKTLIITDSGKKITKENKKITEENVYQLSLSNRLNEQNLNYNNVYLRFKDPDWQKDMKIHCFKKHENRHIEINHNYMYNTYNNTEVNSVDVINNIVKCERENENNRGHITFIFIVCREFPFSGMRQSKTQKNKNRLIRANSLKRQNITDIATKDSEEEENAREKQREINAKEKQEEEILENQKAVNAESIFNKIKKNREKQREKQREIKAKEKQDEKILKNQKAVNMELINNNTNRKKAIK
jgi:hypothetical protein